MLPNGRSCTREIDGVAKGEDTRGGSPANTWRFLQLIRGDDLKVAWIWVDLSDRVGLGIGYPEVTIVCESKTRCSVSEGEFLDNLITLYHQDFFVRGRSEHSLSNGDHTDLLSTPSPCDELEASIFCTDMDPIISTEVDTIADNSYVCRPLLCEGSVIEYLDLL